ncbi:MAG: hypothetical protein WC308_03150 [archaeon]|jgi:predicted neutral ceramidase superfamily lipid hydrolase
MNNITRNVQDFLSAGISFENKQIIAYATGLILIPLLLQNQIITGTFVNALLIMAALNYSLKKTFFLSFIPSIVVFSTGLFFGELTTAILLILPFIWAGNLFIMVVSKKVFCRKNNRFFIKYLRDHAQKQLFYQEVRSCFFLFP